MPVESDGDPAARAAAGPHPVHNLWRLRRYLRPYAAEFAWLLVAGLAGTAASIAVPLVVQRVVDGPVARHEPGGLLQLGGLALLLGVVEAVLIFIRRWVQSSSAVGMEATLRADVYAHLQRLPASFHDRWQSGQLLSRITSDLSVIRRFLSFGVFFLVLNLVTYVVVVVLLIRLHAALGLLVAASAVPLLLITRRFGRHYHTASRRMQDQQGDVATMVEETAQGLRTMKAYGRGPEMAARFAGGARALHDTGVGKGRLLANTAALLDLVPNVTLGVVLVAGAAAAARGALTIGELVAFASLQLMLIWPVQSLGWIIANGQEAATAADRVQEVLDTPPQIVDKPGALALARDAVHGRLRFERVAFRYPGTAAPVLHEIDLTIEPGETLALVGATGCGKSTLLSLVPRLHEVTGGRITVDGHDLRDLRLGSLRRLVGMAFEEPTLFSMSVRENLTLGRPDADDDEVRAALALAQADFAYDLPWGLSTRVGEQGLSLSGGQRQRLALARAVLGRPALLVLDDPLSALDVHTEALVEAALRQVLRNSTALLVVHRPSTISLADRVALLDGGRITAIGKHSELLATVPAYRALLAAEPPPSGGDESSSPTSDGWGLVRS
ncbi:ABC transporter ATP-binding protein [Micromonospora sp. NPDC000316]|uniref:ABC transporter ATP-binding protein n=1 Tax=Micromonospora sp. NPDC000316 TaxID=3364216 RepID=UPI003696A625